MREPSHQELVDYVASLRKVLEEAERNRSGSAFHAGRIEVNVTASVAQVRGLDRFLTYDVSEIHPEANLHSSSSGNSLMEHPRRFRLPSDHN